MVESAFEEGPSFTEEGQFYDPEYSVIPEEQKIDIEEMDISQLMLNPEAIPVIGEDFTVDAIPIDQEILINNPDAVISA